MLPRTLEYKNAPETGHVAEVKAALDGIAKTVADGLKSVNTRMDDIERKANRAQLMGHNGGPKLDDETLTAERKALGVLVRTGEAAEFKAMSVGSDPDGGYWVHSAISPRITKRLYDLSPLRNLCRKEVITVGDAFEEPLDTDEAEAVWVGEQESRPVTTHPRVGVRTTPVNEIYSLVKVSQKLIDDSGYDVGGWVQGKVSDKFGRSEAASFVSGNGVKKPRGFLSYDTDTTADGVRDWQKLQHVVSGHATEITADSLRDLYWSLRGVHRLNARFLMASSVANSIDKLKDGNGEYLWRNGMTAGAPPSLLGLPVEFDENMPAASAGTFPIALADWYEAYCIVEKAGIKWLQDPYTAKPFVLVYGYRRIGGSVANSDAIKLLKVAAS